MEEAKETEHFSLRQWLTFAHLDRIPRDEQLRLLRKHGSPGEAIAYNGLAFYTSLSQDLFTKRIEECAEWAGHDGNHVIAFGEEGYPEALLRSLHPPLLLYASGDAALLERRKLMVIGEVDATGPGIRNAEIICRVLAEREFAIISGMGGGIEEGARTGAQGSSMGLVTLEDSIFDRHGRCTAKPGTVKGSLKIFGIAHVAARLAEDRMVHRIGIDVSDACLVAEAALRSETLKLAEYALEQGREVFAVPGSINSANYKGCHRLIRDGAHLVENYRDVLDVMGRQSGK